MKTCPSCSAEADDQHGFCGSCGHSLVVDANADELEAAWNYEPLVTLYKRYAIVAGIAGMSALCIIVYPKVRPH